MNQPQQRQPVLFPPFHSVVLGKRTHYTIYHSVSMMPYYSNMSFEEISYAYWLYQRGLLNEDNIDDMYHSKDVQKQQPLIIRHSHPQVGSDKWNPYLSADTPVFTSSTTSDDNVHVIGVGNIPPDITESEVITESTLKNPFGYRNIITSGNSMINQDQPMTTVIQQQEQEAQLITTRRDDIHVSIARENDRNCLAQRLEISEDSLTHPNELSTQQSMKQFISNSQHRSDLKRVVPMDYYTIPPFTTSQLLTDESDPVVVDFCVGRRGYGEIKFLGKTNIRELNWDQITITDDRIGTIPLIRNWSREQQFNDKTVMVTLYLSTGNCCDNTVRELCKKNKSQIVSFTGDELVVLLQL